MTLESLRRQVKVNVCYRGVTVHDPEVGQEIEHLGRRCKIVKMRPATHADDLTSMILHEVFVEPIDED
jgi:hypothetical protein